MKKNNNNFKKQPTRKVSNDRIASPKKIKKQSSAKALIESSPKTKTKQMASKKWVK